MEKSCNRLSEYANKGIVCAAFYFWAVKKPEICIGLIIFVVLKIAYEEFSKG